MSAAARIGSKRESCARPRRRTSRVSIDDRAAAFTRSRRPRSRREEREPSEPRGQRPPGALRPAVPIRLVQVRCAYREERFFRRGQGRPSQLGVEPAFVPVQESRPGKKAACVERVSNQPSVARTCNDEPEVSNVLGWVGPCDRQYSTKRVLVLSPESPNSRSSQSGDTKRPEPHRLRRMRPQRKAGPPSVPPSRAPVRHRRWSPRTRDSRPVAGRCAVAPRSRCARRQPACPRWKALGLRRAKLLELPGDEREGVADRPSQLTRGILALVNGVLATEKLAQPCSWQSLNHLDRASTVRSIGRVKPHCGNHVHHDDSRL